MSKVIQFFLVLVLLQTSVFAQKNVNDYKYIVIPNQFDFQRSDDQYQLNSLTKFLFNKYGYQAYFEDEDLPVDVSQDRCLALKADLKKLKGFLITRLQFELKDCNGNIVSTSKVGETKVKQYDTAYNIALRQAFETYQNMNYTYEPKEDVKTPVVAIEEVVEKPIVKQDTIEQKKELAEAEIQEEVAKKQIEIPEAKTPEVEKVVSTETIPQPVKISDKSWYATPIDNGFQVVDSSKNKVMTLLYSGASDVYIVKDENAIVFKKEGYWMYSSNDGSGIKVNRIDLKF
ncbi:hypothetical protein [Psychroserpens sp.]|uniref:hypothetical protein n=1 Tax=Psychroserpens sp. TaxID=2020870 RepID=UPI001B168EFF|nr:hypothetical protein [Psychroserpens sp.]MBO6606204.1 hypothetical protein [Psychroserpens sp.]MBO6632567.1 hypothetical protein [Psychroserpens sp.]MBO6652424.1 hypothetical protein [Psychroserpens sp.]MBO6681804.1 hypothetical protein [Psychroserpens sp.]MBO6749579.1 hypothetical protein [Psychroserpens sp.]